MAAPHTPNLGIRSQLRTMFRTPATRAVLKEFMDFCNEHITEAKRIAAEKEAAEQEEEEAEEQEFEENKKKIAELEQQAEEEEQKGEE